MKRKCVTLRLIALKSEDRWQIQRKPAEIISAESFVFKIGLPISRHNFTQSQGHCLMLTKTKIIKKIAGLAHVVFIRSLLFSLFLAVRYCEPQCFSLMSCLQRVKRSSVLSPGVFYFVICWPQINWEEASPSLETRPRFLSYCLLKTGTYLRV